MDASSFVLRLPPLHLGHILLLMKLDAAGHTIGTIRLPTTLRIRDGGLHSNRRYEILIG